MASGVEEDIKDVAILFKNGNYSDDTTYQIQLNYPLYHDFNLSTM